MEVESIFRVVYFFLVVSVRFSLVRGFIGICFRKEEVREFLRGS